jgi:hypothetical protein
MYPLIWENDSSTARASRDILNMAVGLLTLPKVTAGSFKYSSTEFEIDISIP